MDRAFVVLGAVSGFISVAAGAFGAHALRGSLSAELLEVFETAARYQMYHALALFAVAWLYERAPCPATVVAGWAFVAGTLLFCGSLYTLSLTGVRWIGAVTPFGGIAFLAGWLALAYTALRCRG